MSKSQRVETLAVAGAQVAHLVINFPLLRIAQNFIGAGDLLKLFFRIVLFVRIAVGMPPPATAVAQWSALPLLQYSNQNKGRASENSLSMGPHRAALR